MDDFSAKSGNKATLEDLYLYFDGVERDRLDAAGMSRRSGEILALRDRLMRLPEAEFDVVIRTLRSVINDGGGDTEKKSDTKQRARTLYDSVRAPSSSASSTTKVSRT